MRKEDKKELQLYGYFAWMVVSLFVATQFVHQLVFRMVDESFLEPVPVANLSVLVFLILANFVYLKVVDRVNERAAKRKAQERRKRYLKERMERKWS